MTTTSQPHPLPAPTKAARRRSRPVKSRPRRHAAQASCVTPVMGPPNRAPGVSIMGEPSQGLHADLMGGPDAGRRVPLMGESDHGTRLDLFGRSDPSFPMSVAAPTQTVNSHPRRTT